MTVSEILPPYQSFFWLRAPIGDVRLKKEKKKGDLVSFFNKESIGKNEVSALLCRSDSVVPMSDRCLTIFEQPRSPNENETFRFQPIDDIEKLVNLVHVMQDVSHDHMPLHLGGKGFQIVEKTNKIQLMLGLNEESSEEFQDFYDHLMAAVAEEFNVYDFYKRNRVPRIVLAKGYKADLNGRLRDDKRQMRSLIRSFKDQNERLQTKPMVLDHLILGQGFYKIDGKHRLASRDVATIYFDENKGFEWHCNDPFDRAENDELVVEEQMLRQQSMMAKSAPSLAFSK